MKWIKSKIYRNINFLIVGDEVIFTLQRIITNNTLRLYEGENWLASNKVLNSYLIINNNEIEKIKLAIIRKYKIQKLLNI